MLRQKPPEPAQSYYKYIDDKLTGSSGPSHRLMRLHAFWASVQQAGNPPSSHLLSVRATDALPLSDHKLPLSRSCVVVSGLALF